MLKDWKVQYRIIRHSDSWLDSTLVQDNNMTRAEAEKLAKRLNSLYGWKMYRAIEQGAEA